MTTDELTLNDEVFLRAVRLTAFDADPERLEPLRSSNLSWRITVPQHRPAVKLQLHGGGLAMSVAASGTRRVAPVFSTEYSLVATLPRASRVLGRRQVQVDTSDCFESSFSEAALGAEVTKAVDDQLAEHHELRRRRNDSTEVRPDGAHIAIRLHAVLDDAPNPDIDVDATVQLRATAGLLTYQLTRFALDIDYSWWKDALILTFMPAWLSLAMTENNEKALMRGRLREQLDLFVSDANTTAADLGYQFLYLRSQTDSFVATLCPIRAGVPRGEVRPGTTLGPAAGPAASRAPDG